MVLVRARQDPDALVLEGWEDLNKNYEIDDGEDDKLFDIVKRNEQHEMRGYGANSYYNHGFGAGSFLFTYLIISSLGPRGYYYNTAPVYARNNLNRHRDNYRGSSRYRSQVSRNSSYFTSQKTGFASSRYNSSGRSLSTARTSYRSDSAVHGLVQEQLHGRAELLGARGAAEARSGRRGGGRSSGFRGFGGGQRIIGLDRWAG